jgi:hypothetical protein
VDNDSSNLEQTLKQILDSFDKKNKYLLAVELVEKLRLERHGESYATQVEELAGRRLSRSEVFKLDILNRLLNHLGGGGGNGEEEE